MDRGGWVKGQTQIQRTREARRHGNRFFKKGQTDKQTETETDKEIQRPWR